MKPKKSVSNLVPSRDDSRKAERKEKRKVELTLKTCSAKTRANELRVFSPPERLEIFFQLFLGGMTLKMIPSEKGSRESTSSNSAFPPSVIICQPTKLVNKSNLNNEAEPRRTWYIDLSCIEMIPNPSMNSLSLWFRRSSDNFFAASRSFVTDSRSAARWRNSFSLRAYSFSTERSRLEREIRSEESKGEVGLVRASGRKTQQAENLRTFENGDLGFENFDVEFENLVFRVLVKNVVELRLLLGCRSACFALDRFKFVVFVVSVQGAMESVFNQAAKRIHKKPTRQYRSAGGLQVWCSRN